MQSSWIEHFPDFKFFNETLNYTWWKYVWKCVNSLQFQLQKNPVIFWATIFLREFYGAGEEYYLIYSRKKGGGGGFISPAHWGRGGVVLNGWQYLSEPDTIEVLPCITRCNISCKFQNILSWNSFLYEIHFRFTSET